MTNVLDRTKAKLQEFKEEEFQNLLIVECRNKVSAFGEEVLLKMEEANIEEEDVSQLMSVFVYITRKYLEALPEINSDMEENYEPCNTDEIKEMINEQKATASYACEYIRLNMMHMELAWLILSFDFEKERPSLMERLKELQKIAEDEPEKQLKNIAKEREEDPDPYVCEIGTHVSKIRLFEKMMGKQPELEAVWKKIEEAAVNG